MPEQSPEQFSNYADPLQLLGECGPGKDLQKEVLQVSLHSCADCGCLCDYTARACLQPKAMASGVWILAVLPSPSVVTFDLIQVHGTPY